MDNSRYIDLTQQYPNQSSDNGSEKHSVGNFSSSPQSVADNQVSSRYEGTASSFDYQGDVLQKHSIYPPGLEFLAPVSSLLIDQKIQKTRSWLNLHRKNNYRILNDENEQIYEIVEDNEVKSLTHHQVFTMNIFDKYGREALRVERPFRWFKNKIEVFNENILLGTVNQKMLTFKPHYQVRDSLGNVLYKIILPILMWQTSCSFKIVEPTQDACEIGEINKQFTNWRQELTTNADVYTINFPVDTDVKHKALLLAAIPFIDIVYFEGHRSGSYR